MSSGRPDASGHEFTGVLTAIATPMSADGVAVDFTALTALLERQVAAGVSGVVPNGTTGEFFSLTHDERRQVVEHCVDVVGDRVQIVPQTGALTTAEAVALSRHAEQSGCAAVLAMPPYFTPASPDALRRYYHALVQSLDVPVILYHNPGVTGVELSASALVALCVSVGIRHVKYTSPDVSGVTELLLEHADAVQTLPAWDHLALTAFLSGARCSIWGAAAAVPELCVDLLDAVARGEWDRTLGVWRRAAPLFSGFGALGYIPAVKAASARLGLSLGPPRPPLAPLGPEAEARIAALLEDAGYDTGTVVSYLH